MARSASRRTQLREIAEATLDVVKRGHYTLNGTKHSLEPALASAKNNTSYYAPDSILSNWSQPSGPHPHTSLFSVLEISTLDGARLLSTQAPDARIGMLNFASAKKPGGGFLSGAQAQEESLARSSTLYASLTSPVGARFYALHTRSGGQKGGYYTHAMLYTPHVTFFRDDGGAWVAPLTADVLTSAAVNAGVVRGTLFGRVGGQAGTEEAKIAREMKERMGRLLFLFERQGATCLVLGSFGTGVFQNDVKTIARIWRELLKDDGARFKGVFERVVFAVLGRQTYDDFKSEFDGT